MTLRISLHRTACISRDAKGTIRGMEGIKERVDFGRRIKVYKALVKSPQKAKVGGWRGQDLFVSQV